MAFFDNDEELSTAHLLSKVEAEIKYVNQSGDFMEGDLNMNHFKIINLPEPVGSSEAVNKEYCDNLVENCVLKNSPVISASFNANSNRIYNLGSCTMDDDCCSKGYCDQKVSNIQHSTPHSNHLSFETDKVKMKRPISMEKNKLTDLPEPLVDSDACTKKYADDKISTAKIFPFSVTHVIRNKIGRVKIEGFQIGRITDTRQIIVYALPSRVTSGGILVTVSLWLISKEVRGAREDPVSLSLTFGISCNSSSSTTELRNITISGCVYVAPEVPAYTSSVLTSTPTFRGSDGSNIEEWKA